MPYLRSTARDFKKWAHHSYEGLKILNSNMIKICLSKLTDGAEKQLVAGVKKSILSKKNENAYTFYVGYCYVKFQAQTFKFTEEKRIHHRRFPIEHLNAKQYLQLLFATFIAKCLLKG